MYVLDPGFQFWVTHFSAIVFDLSLLVLSTKSEKQKEFKTGLCNLIDFLSFGHRTLFLECQ